MMTAAGDATAFKRFKSGINEKVSPNPWNIIGQNIIIMSE